MGQAPKQEGPTSKYYPETIEAMTCDLKKTVPRIFSTGNPPKDATSTLLYLRKDELHETEKPYKLQYNTEDEIPQQNTVQENRESIPIRDLRGQTRSFSFEKNGFSVLDLESEMEPEDFGNEHKVKDVYYPEIQARLLKYFGAKRVEVLEHQVSYLHLIKCMVLMRM